MPNHAMNISYACARAPKSDTSAIDKGKTWASLPHAKARAIKSGNTRRRRKRRGNVRVRAWRATKATSEVDLSHPYPRALACACEYACRREENPCSTNRGRLNETQ